MLRIAKCLLGATWGMSMLTVGFTLWLHVNPLMGLCIVAMGEYVLMLTVLDDLVRPVNVETVGFLKLTAAIVVLLSAGFVIRDWQAILLP